MAAIHDRSPDYFVGAWRNVQVSIIFSSSIAMLDATDRSMGKLLATHPGGTLSLSIVANVRENQMTPELRRRSQEISEKYKTEPRASAIVLEGTGLVMSMIRAFVASLTLLSGRPSKVFADVDSGVAWLVQKAGPGAPIAKEPASFKAALLSLRGGERRAVNGR